MKISKKLKDSASVATEYSHLGRVFLSQYEWEMEEKEFKGNSTVMLLDSASFYYSKALKVQKKLGNPIPLIHTMDGLASIQLINDNPNEALSLYKEASTLSKKLRAKKEISLTDLGIAKSYEKLEDYKSALDYFRSYSRLKDSLRSTENNEKIAEIEALYKDEKRKRRIAVLEKEKEKEAAISAQKEKQQNLI